MDYEQFGDVVSFDTTFGTNKEGRPFVVFVGVNHFRATIVFGGAFTYDETFKSFKWLFQSFLKAHNGQQQKTNLYRLRCCNEKDNCRSVFRSMAWVMHFSHYAECHQTST
jgi:hypothetical protein